MKDCYSYCIGGSSCDGCPNQFEEDFSVYTTEDKLANTKVTSALDFFGKTFFVGDEVVAVFGKHLRRCKVESFGYRIGNSTNTGFERTTVKVNGLVRELESDHVIKI